MFTYKIKSGDYRYYDISIIIEESDVIGQTGEMVDLGLPSGTKWADRNVGASRPDDDGLYFAWGETKGFYESERVFDEKHLVVSERIRKCDNVLDPRDDAATMNWGNDWRMPTKDEMKELLDNCKIEYAAVCNSNWSVRSSGFLITSKINDNSIFSPATGQIDGTECLNHGIECYYWTASPSNNLNNLECAYNLFIRGYDKYEIIYPRRCYMDICPNGDFFLGCSIRPVKRIND